MLFKNYLRYDKNNYDYFMQAASANQEIIQGAKSYTLEFI